MFGLFSGGGPLGLPYGVSQILYLVNRIQADWINSDHQALVQGRIGGGSAQDLGINASTWQTGQTSTDVDVRAVKNGVATAWVTTIP